MDEAFISDSQEVQINVSNRQVEQVNAVHYVGIGIRILKDQKMISGSSNDLAKDSVKELISDLALGQGYILTGMTQEKRQTTF